MISGGLGHGIGGAISDDCHHLSREFVKVEFEVFFPDNSLILNLADVPSRIK